MAKGFRWRSPSGRRAVLYNGLGNYPEAMAAAQQALYHQEYPDLHYPGIANWAAAELIEAAARSGMADTAAEATDWITEMTGQRHRVGAWGGGALARVAGRWRSRRAAVPGSDHAPGAQPCAYRARPRASSLR